MDESSLSRAFDGLSNEVSDLKVQQARNDGRIDNLYWVVPIWLTIITLTGFGAFLKGKKEVKEQYKAKS